jgi:hypothetical protein
MTNCTLELDWPETLVDESAIEKLTKDVKKAALTLNKGEARFLVDLYYQWQDERKRSDNQVRALDASKEPNQCLRWLSSQSTALELRVKQLLQQFANGQRLGRWCQSIDGLGPVITSGLLAHYDVNKSETAGGYWRFAGLDPTSQWLGTDKAKALVNDLWKPQDDYSYETLCLVAQRINRRPEVLLGMSKNKETGKVTRASLIKATSLRPWNASLRTLCWKVGESFVKVCNKDTAIYGNLYTERKVKETKMNEDGLFKDQAKQKLETCNIGKDTDAYAAYSQGMLPKAHIHSRAKRYAVKIFISHYHHWDYFLTFDKLPPKPFAIDILKHAQLIAPPPMVD